MIKQFIIKQANKLFWLSSGLTVFLISIVCPNFCIPMLLGIPLNIWLFASFLNKHAPVVKYNDKFINHQGKPLNEAKYLWLVALVIFLVFPYSIPLGIRFHPILLLIKLGISFIPSTIIAIYLFAKNTHLSLALSKTYWQFKQSAVNKTLNSTGLNEVINNIKFVPANNYKPRSKFHTHDYWRNRSSWHKTQYPQHKTTNVVGDPRYSGFSMNVFNSNRFNSYNRHKS